MLMYSYSGYLNTPIHVYFSIFLLQTGPYDNSAFTMLQKKLYMIDKPGTSYYFKVINQKFRLYNQYTQFTFLSYICI